MTGAPSTIGNDVQLNTTTVIRHAGRTYAEQPIIYRTPDMLRVVSSLIILTSFSLYISSGMAADGS